MHSWLAQASSRFHETYETSKSGSSDWILGSGIQKTSREQAKIAYFAEKQQFNDKSGFTFWCLDHKKLTDTFFQLDTNKIHLRKSVYIQNGKLFTAYLCLYVEMQQTYCVLH